jgi:plasmid maintenance system antidote protein VapI
MSFTCPRCGMTSAHPEDERQGYCGNCHAFTGEDFDPDWVISPGETLRDWMEEHRFSVRVTATLCGLEQAIITGVLNATVPLSERTAHRLAAGTGIPAKLWLNLERAYRDGLAAGKTDVSGP